MALISRPLPHGYAHAIRELYSLQSFGIKLGLRNIRGLLRSMGDPHHQLRAIHIAGTNGKGSTAAGLASILTDAGYRTGLYTSPHLVDFRERIRIDGREIPARSVVDWTRRLLPEVWRRRSTFFEAVTAMAFGWFAEENVDVAVIETGLGGRLDATNVVSPFLTVITTIGLEHTAILGPTVERIAFEKAGIIKSGVPCILGFGPGKARRVVERRARCADAPIVDATTVSLRTVQESLEGTSVEVQFDSHEWTTLRIGMAGSFQVQNLRTILAAVQTLRRKGLPIPDGAVDRGLRDIERISGVRGRCSVVRHRPRIIIDVGHNPPALNALVHSLRDLKVRPSITVLGVAADKNLTAIARAVGRVSGEVIAVAARTSRARPAGEVAAAFRSLGIASRTASSVAEGVRGAVQKAGAGGTVLVTGSHFVVGEALAFLERRQYLTISQ